ncbi:hypothetical protein [Pseudomonas sp. NPDC088444]|uniref:hypothetical protein n=1 Tax=Pseudomonas sp. NPDC088444 TaxID=3364456 RepID=UPI00384B5281
MDSLVPLSFEPIDLDAHAKVCVRFALDLHILGFGSTEGFHEADGKGSERHIAHPCTRAASWPGCLVHVWQGGRINADPVPPEWRPPLRQNPCRLGLR